MRKLLQGIAEYHRKVRPDYQHIFAKLALEQKPDALLIACSDSRVAPNLFASTEPGDVFVVRNPGNIIPAHGSSPSSEAAAIEFATGPLKVKDVIVCGHSECGAMKALMGGDCGGALGHWLHNAAPALENLNDSRLKSDLAPHNRLSQINVLEQMKHILSYPVAAEEAKRGELCVHGWWFDIAEAEVLHYVEEERRFVVIDDAEVEKFFKAEKFLGRGAQTF